MLPVPKSTLLQSNQVRKIVEEHKETLMPKSKRRIPLSFLVSCALLLLSATTTLLAQGERGTFNGIVTDNSGAVVPNAEVSALHLDTNIETKTSTTDAGVYRMPYLPLGTYKITVKANGFQSAVAENVTLRVAQTLTLDFKLQVGQITEQVTVSSEAPLIESGTADQPLCHQERI